MVFSLLFYLSPLLLCYFASLNYSVQRHHFPLSYSLGSVFSDGKRTEHKSELALLKQQQEVSSIQEQQLSNLQKDTIHNKKSFYHHLETIQKAIRSEQYTEALSSLESLLLRPSRSNPASYCADSYINAVLQFKQEEAHRYGISVNYQILLPDLQLLKISLHPNYPAFYLIYWTMVSKHVSNLKKLHLKSICKFIQREPCSAFIWKIQKHRLGHFKKQLQNLLQSVMDSVLEL